MLLMRLKTKDQIVKTLSESSIQKLAIKQICSNDDLEEVIKLAQAILRTGDKSTVYVVAG